MTCKNKEIKVQKDLPNKEDKSQSKRELKVLRATSASRELHVIEKEEEERKKKSAHFESF